MGWRMENLRQRGGEEIATIYLDEKREKLGKDIWLPSKLLGHVSLRSRSQQKAMRARAPGKRGYIQTTNEEGKKPRGSGFLRGFGAGEIERKLADKGVKRKEVRSEMRKSSQGGSSSSKAVDSEPLFNGTVIKQHGGVQGNGRSESEKSGLSGRTTMFNTGKLPVLKKGMKRCQPG